MGSTGFTQLLSSTSDTWSLHRKSDPHEVRDDEVLVKTAYVGLNPFDWKGIKYKFGLKEAPSVLGRDGSGVIIAVGESVTRLKVGDKVWFCANSALPNSGAFQEYSVHRANEVGLLPSNVSLRAGATLGTGLLTAAIVLFKCFQLSLSSIDPRERSLEKGPWIFIVSGSGITGQYLIQLSRLLGLRVICTGSVSNHQNLKNLGATLVLDRHAPIEKLAKLIQAATSGDLIQQGVDYAVDNVGPSTVELCHRVLDDCHTRSPSQLVALAGSSKMPYIGKREITSIPISFSTTFFGQPEFSVPLLDKITSLLASRHLKASDYEIAPDGLNGISDALLRLESGTVGPMKKLLVGINTRRPVSKPKQKSITVSIQSVGRKRKVRSEEDDDRPNKTIRPLIEVEA